MLLLHVYHFCCCSDIVGCLFFIILGAVFFVPKM